MATMDDVRALLADAKDEITALRPIHDDAIADAAQRPRLRAKVKSILEQERSALDYLAVGITERFGTPRTMIYYPLAQNDKGFAGEIDQKMPGVRTAMPGVAEAIRNHQPFQHECDWIRDLNQLTREHKHRGLALQLIRNVKWCRVTEDATGDVVEWNGARFRPGYIVSEGGYVDVHANPGRDPSSPAPFEHERSSPYWTPYVFGVPIDPATERPLPHAGLTVEYGEESQWWFYRPHWPVLNGLGYFLARITAAVREISQAAGL